ncbi:unnamed protein product [Amoebophrya sp. A25]|nr:unnamed protein product [Amoebophrya sp. A25]|eukprot:GSA25T00002060001.1
MKMLCALRESLDGDSPEKYEVSIAVIGPPKSGKSTLIDALVGAQVTSKGSANPVDSTNEADEDDDEEGGNEEPTESETENFVDRYHVRLESQKKASSGILGAIFGERKTSIVATERELDSDSEDDGSRSFDVSCESLLTPADGLPAPAELIFVDVPAPLEEGKKIEEFWQDHVCDVAETSDFMVLVLDPFKDSAAECLVETVSALLGICGDEGIEDVFRKVLFVLNKADSGENFSELLGKLIAEACAKVRPVLTETLRRTGDVAKKAGNKNIESRAHELLETLLRSRFVTLSALCAFALRVEGGVSREVLKTDPELLDMIARRDFPLAYSGYSLLSPAEQVDAVHRYLSNLSPEKRSARLASVGLEKVTTVLESRFGGKRFGAFIADELKAKAENTLDLSEMRAFHDHALRVNPKEGFDLRKVYLEHWAALLQHMEATEESATKPQNFKELATVAVTKLDPDQYCKDEGLYTFGERVEAIDEDASADVMDKDRDHAGDLLGHIRRCLSYVVQCALGAASVETIIAGADEALDNEDKDENVILVEDAKLSSVGSTSTRKASTSATNKKPATNRTSTTSVNGAQSSSVSREHFRTLQVMERTLQSVTDKLPMASSIALARLFKDVDENADDEDDIDEEEEDDDDEDMEDAEDDDEDVPPALHVVGFEAELCAIRDRMRQLEAMVESQASKQCKSPWETFVDPGDLIAQYSASYKRCMPFLSLFYEYGLLCEKIALQEITFHEEVDEERDEEESEDEESDAANEAEQTEDDAMDVDLEGASEEEISDLVEKEQDQDESFEVLSEEDKEAADASPSCSSPAQSDAQDSSNVQEDGESDVRNADTERSQSSPVESDEFEIVDGVGPNKKRGRLTEEDGSQGAGKRRAIAGGDSPEEMN